MIVRLSACCLNLLTFVVKKDNYKISYSQTVWKGNLFLDLILMFMFDQPKSTKSYNFGFKGCKGAENNNKNICDMDKCVKLLAYHSSPQPDSSGLQNV